MGIIDNKIINQGKIIDNYLVNFPQFINKEKNSIYKLVIGEQITVFVIDLTNIDGNGNISIQLPYEDFTVENSHNVFISWGDEGQDSILREEKITGQIVHEYKQRKVYIITILGDTPNLISIQNKIDNDEDVSDELMNFKNSLISIKTLSDNLTNLNGVFKGYKCLCEIPDNELPFHVKNCDEMFDGCSSLEVIPFNFQLPGEGISFKRMFANSGIKLIANQDLCLPVKTSNVESMFENTKIDSFPTQFFRNINLNLTSLKSMFENCNQLLSFTSNKVMKYITNIENIFFGCSKIKQIYIQLPNVEELSRSFCDCFSLRKVEGLKINQNTKDASNTFLNCYNLKIDVNDIIEYDNLDIQILKNTFQNCTSLIGTPQEEYLWKSKDMRPELSNLNTFKDCNSLQNYNFIISQWGGADEVNYWYGSYEVDIEEDNEIYCLPLYKFKEGDTEYNKNHQPTTLNFNKNDINKYDFYINYGDDTTWLHIIVENTIYFNNLWENNKQSDFYGYPLTYKINYIDNNTINNDKHLAYDTIMQKYFGYIFKDITHIYKEKGKYKISIKGRMPRFYIQENDVMTNRHLYNIITINRLPLISLNHAFTNAMNLRYLPNEDLTKFPKLYVVSPSIEDIMAGRELSREECLQQIVDSSYCFGIKNCVDKLLKKPLMFNINMCDDTFKDRDKNKIGV